ncbi:hypothetical protein ABBQ32_007114 [Trebouxia sp. C0010 RCD-2024]
MQSAGFFRPAGLAAPSSPFARGIRPAALGSKLTTLDEDQLELTERDLWEEDADLSEDDAMPISTSSPKLGLDHSSESEHEAEPPSPDIKAFRGDSQPDPQEADSESADQTEDQAPSTQPSARGSMEQSRLSTDSSSARPIASVSQGRSRRPPLRANSTFVSRTGLQPRAAIKMGSSAPINIPIMSRLPSIRDEDVEDAPKKPFVPPHLVGEQKQGDSLQQFTMIAGGSTGASVKSRKLQQRNAILRRTGFIEGPASAEGVGEVLDPIKESHLECFHSRSKLTEALGSSPQVGSSS